MAHLYLLKIRANTPDNMDPEVRADLIQRTRELLPENFHQVVGQHAVVGFVETEDIDTWVQALPLAPWADITITPLSRS